MKTSDEDRTWFLVRLPVHERAILAVTEHDTDQATPQDKSLLDKKKDQATPQATDHVEQLVIVLTGEMSRTRTQAALELKDRHHFLASYLKPALKAGLIEMTLPEKPNSRYQQYRRTASGEAMAEQIKRRNAAK